MNIYRKKITATALLLLFLFGTTPKLFLHYLIADHKDNSFFSSLNKEGSPVKQVSKAPVNCHCDSTVIESPFVEYNLQTVTPVPLAYTLLLFTYADAYSLPHHSYIKLRGPPAAGTPVV